MSEEFLKNEIFTPFAQEYNSTTAQYSGSGLGLSIVKALVEQMGGHIEVESKQGEGTTFLVYLDFEKVDEQEAKATLNTQATTAENGLVALQGKKILLAEDHPLNAEIAKKLLLKAGCETTWAKNGKEAVTMFEAAPADGLDVILMDIRMPEMDGLEATKQIRAMARTDAATVPIIAMSANAYDEDVEKSFAAGMNTHLGKPIVPKDLYDALAKYIS